MVLKEWDEEAEIQEEKSGSVRRERKMKEKRIK